MKEKIETAIAAHSAWKSKLRSAIDTGKSDFDPRIVAQDNQCEFGKWIYGLPASETADEHFIEVKNHHAAFHKAAAKVLTLALEGKKAEAEKEIGLNSEFATVSSKCMLTLMDWKKKISQ